MVVKKDQPEHGLPSLALVFGYIAVKDFESMEKKIAVLARLGYGNEEMAKICGTTQGTIRTIKSKGKTGGKKKKAGKK